MGEAAIGSRALEFLDSPDTRTSPHAVDRGEYRIGGRGSRPIGVNLPDGCNEFSLIPSSIRQSASSHLCPEAVLFQ